MSNAKLPKSAIIVGAGIGGLAAANLLAKAGVSVTVYEKAATPGGRAGMREIEGFRFDTGPSWYLMPEVFEHYFTSIGKDVHDYLDLIKLAPGYKVFFENTAPMIVTGDISVDGKTFDAHEPGAAAALGKYLEQSSRVYTMATKHFLYNNFQLGRWALSTEIIGNGLPMLKMMRTSIHDHVQKYFKSQELQQIMEYPMVFLGTSPYEAPAMYSLMSHMDFTQGVFYPQGGMYTIIEALVRIGQELGVEYRYSSEVSQITSVGGVAKGILLQSGETVFADIVVSNGDLHHTETKLLPAELQTYPEQYWDKKTASPSALLLYLGVRGELPMLEHHNLFFVDAWKENFDAIYKTKQWPESASIYVCKPSATDPSVAPEGHENIFVLVPLPATLEGLPDQDIYVQKYLEELQVMAGVPDLTERIVVKEVFGPQDFADTLYAWRGTALGMAHPLSQSAFFRPANTSKKVQNLYYVGGNTVPGIGLPMCLISAELLYKRLTGDTTDHAIASEIGS